MDDTSKKLISLFYLFKASRSQECSRQLIYELNKLSLNDEHVFSDKIYGYSTTILFSMIDLREKIPQNFLEILFDILILLSKVVRLEASGFFVKVIQVLLNYVVKEDNASNLILVEHNDVNISKILDIIYALLISNENVYIKVLLDSDFKFIYAYLAASINEVLSKNKCKKVLVKAIKILNSPHAFLTKKCTPCSKKLKVAEFLSSVSPGITISGLKLFQSNVGYNKELKLACLELFYYNLAVLRNDKWQENEYNEQSVDKDTEKFNENRRNSYVVLDSVVKSVLNEKMINLYESLASLLVYIIKNCFKFYSLDQKNVEFIFESITKLLCLDNSKVEQIIIPEFKSLVSFNSDSSYEDSTNTSSGILEDKSLSRNMLIWNKFSLSFSNELIMKNNSCSDKNLQILASLDIGYNHEISLCFCGFYDKLFYKLYEELSQDALHLCEETLIYNINCLFLSVSFRGYNIVDSSFLPFFIEMLIHVIDEGAQRSVCKEIDLKVCTLVNKSGHNIVSPIENKKVSNEKLFSVINKIIFAITYYADFFVLTNYLIERFEFYLNKSRFDYANYYLHFVIQSIYCASFCPPFLKTYILCFNEDVLNHKKGFSEEIIYQLHNVIFSNSALFSSHGGCYLFPLYQEAMNELSICFDSSNFNNNNNQFDNSDFIDYINSVYKFISLSCKIIGNDYINLYFQQVLFTLMFLRCSSSTILSVGAKNCIEDITEHSEYTSFIDIVKDFKEFLIDEAYMEMRHLSWNNKAPIIFKTLISLEHGNKNLLEIISPIIETLLEVVGTYYEEGLLYSLIVFDAFTNYILDTFVLADESENTDLTSNSQLWKAMYLPKTTESQSVSEFYDEYCRLKRTPTDIYNGSNENSQDCPKQFQLIQKIIETCVHFFNCKSQTLQILICKLCSKCLRVFDGKEIVVFPTIHKLWAPFLFHLGDYTNNLRTYSSTNASASFELLMVMCSQSEDFLKQRIFENMIPLCKNFLLSKCKCSVLSISNITSNAVNSNDTIFDVSMLKIIAFFVHHFDLKDGKYFEELLSICLQYLNKTFSIYLNKEAASCLKILRFYNRKTVDDAIESLVLSHKTLVKHYMLY